MARYLLTDLSEHVLTVTLNRAAAQNALVPGLLSEFIEVFSSLSHRPEVHAVVLRSSSGAFSIGGDLHGFDRHFPDIRDYAYDIVGKLNQAMLAMIDAPQPIVTAVHGIVTGGSMGLVLASDLVLIGRHAIFKSHYPSVGFSPDGGWGVLLPRIVGMRRAAACLFHNDAIDAKQALDWGIANSILPSTVLHEAAQKTARKIAAYPPCTMRSSKQLLWREREQIARELELERTKFVDLITRDGAREGVRHYLEQHPDYPPESGE